MKKILSPILCRVVIHSKLLFCTILVFWQIQQLYAQAQANFPCILSQQTIPIQTDTNIQQKPTPNTSCGKNSAIFQSFFSKKESFIPVNGITTATSVTKKIKLRFVVIEADPNSAIQRNYRPQNVQDLYKIRDLINQYLANGEQPNMPATNICGACYINDSKLRIDLTDVVFTPVEIPSLDSVLDVKFLINYNSYQLTDPNNASSPPVILPNGEHMLGPGAYASLGTNFVNAQDNTTGFIVSNNNYFNAVWFPQYYGYTDYNYWFNRYARGIYHELLHVTGLNHVFYTPPPNCCMDLVNDPVLGCNASNPDYLADCYAGANSCPVNNNNYNNIMNGNATWYTSPMQLGRVHRGLFLGSVKRYSYPTEAPDVHPWIINSTQTWDFAIRMYQDIRIKNGSTLTIKCEVQMPPNGRIVIEHGGKLIVDGGLITSYHSRTKWKGIEALGNNALASTEQNQGTVEIKNGAIIENAQAGVWNFSFENIGTQGGGGIIRASNSTFYNCLSAAGLCSYNTYSYGNNCSFKNIDFLIEENSPFITQYHMDGNDYFTGHDSRTGIIVDGCRFNNKVPYNIQPQEKRGRAIYMACTGMTISNCSFNNFTAGIMNFGFTNTPTRTTKIYDNSFNHITQNITISAQESGDIRGNKITNMVNANIQSAINPSITWNVTPGYGVYLDNTTGSYVGCQNFVSGVTDMPRLEQYRRVGLLSNNSTKAISTIIDNTFTDMGVGFQTQGNNPKILTSCNLYTKNNVAWLINPADGYTYNHMSNQGNGCFPSQTRAGNRFVSNTKDINSYIWHTNTWSYYAFTGPGNTSQYPYNYSGQVNVYNCASGTSSDPNSQCGKDWKYCLRTFTSADVKNLRTQFILAQKNGQEFELDAQIIKGQVIRGYNDLDDLAGLQSFLEEMNNDEARKMLIPLYIETQQFDRAFNMIGMLSLSEDELKGYNNFYKLITDLKQENRSIDLLSADEISLLEVIADNTLEVTPFAKGILEAAGIRDWYHQVDQEAGVKTMMKKTWRSTESFESKMYDAAPNPTTIASVVKIIIEGSDIDKNPELVIRNYTGQIIERIQIKIMGINYVGINIGKYGAGVFYYSLNLNGCDIQTKKLVVTQ